MTTQTESYTRLHGRWLFSARLAWVAIAILATLVYAAAAPVAFNQLRSGCGLKPCDAPAEIITESASLPQDQITRSSEFGAWFHTMIEAALRLLTLGVALLIFSRRSDDWMAHVASIMLVAVFAVFSPSPMMLANVQPLWRWPITLLRVIALASTVGLFYLFPDGRFVPRWTRGLAIGLLVLIGALAAVGAPFQTGLPVFIIALATGAGFQVYRYRRVSSPLQRQQTKWVVLGITGMVLPMLVFFIFGYLNPSSSPLRSNEPIFSQDAAVFTMMVIFCVIIPLCFLPVTLAFSMLRYRLWDVDIVISRTLVYGALTASVVGLYVLIVGGLGAVLQTQNNLPGIVIAILMIALLFQPLRQRLQDIVNHFVPVPQAIIHQSIAAPVHQTKPQQEIAVTDSAPSTGLRGRSLILARLAWAAGFIGLTVVYIFGFLVVRDALSTVCEDGQCTLTQQIRHTNAGDQVVTSAGPSIGSAERLRPDQVQALEKLGLTLDQYSWLGALQLGIPALFLLLIAAGLFWRKSDDWIVLFASAMVATFSIHNTPLLFTLTLHQPTWGWVSHLATVVALSCLLIFPLIFPNGEFVPRWARWMVLYDVAGAVMASFLGSAMLEVLGGVLGRVFIGLCVLLPFGIGVYAQLYRYFRVARPTERQQFKWVVVGFVGTAVIQFAVLIPLNALLASRAVNADPTQALVLSTIPDTLWQVSILLIPVCITISVLRYRLWDIDIIISRTLVYGTLSAGIVVTYILLVGLLGALLNTHVTLVAALVTAALIVPFFQPLRLRLQRAVNRVTFGGRDVPSPKQEVEESNAEPEILLRQHWLAWLLFDLTCVLSAISLVFLALSWVTRVPDIWGFRGDAVMLALTFGSIGLLLARRHTKNSIGWLLLAAGLVNSIVEFCIEYATYALLTKPSVLPYGTLAAWTASWLWVVAIAMLVYSFLLFPTGHLPSVRWRPAALFIVGAFALMTFSFMIRPGPLQFAPYLDNPFTVPVAYRVLRPISAVNAGGILLIGLSIILRLRRAGGVERQQLKWFAYAATLMTIIGMTSSLVDAAGLTGTNPKSFQYFTVAIWIAIPFAIAFAILRYRLWNIDIFINRSLVYGTLIVSVIALYMIVVGVAGALLQFVGNTFLAILATGLIAVLFHPLRLRLQHGINRLMYGDRDDPYAALSRLGRRLEASLAPEAVLPTVVTTVREVLKLPYVAIYLKQDDNRNKIVAESASPSLRTEGGRIRVPGMEREGHCIPLIHQGDTLGYIVLGPRAPNESFSSSDLRLLDDLAPQVGVAVHGVRLTADLQRSRERLVLAREEERRRLRRDLHDDLGPTLASLGLTASTAADLISTNPDTATAMVKELHSEIRATVGNIRRLVYDLRPPTLDELGLLAAVRERAAQYSNAPDGFDITVEAPAELPVLPAAGEVAAYRIVQEALENVSKHAQARTCSIRFANHNGLEIEITDDGIGLPPNITPGVGLRSMRERAEELGGYCSIERGVHGGTRVLACLPIGEFDGTFAHPDRG